MKITIGQLRKIIKEEIVRNHIHEGVLNLKGFSGNEKTFMNKEKIYEALKQVSNLTKSKLESIFQKEPSLSQVVTHYANDFGEKGISAGSDVDKQKFIQLLKSYKEAGEKGNEFFDEIISQKLKPSDVFGAEGTDGILGTQMKFFAREIIQYLGTLGFTPGKTTSSDKNIVYLQAEFQGSNVSARKSDIATAARGSRQAYLRAIVRYQTTGIHIQFEVKFADS